jgi:glycosyltransferase involved in cell wall biosynthesis
MTPKISVIMPVRDGARWLGKAITSLQNQTLSEFELIVIDDGSADESPRIIAEHSRRDPRIRSIRQERLGLVSALNCGLTDSRGPLIARLDADDLAHPQRLQRQSQYLDSQPDVGLLGTWAERINEQGFITGVFAPPTRPEKLAPLLLRMNPFLHSSIMFRKSILQNIGYYRPVFEGAEDYDMWIRMSEVTKVANLPECLLQYRVHAASVTHRARVRQLFSVRLAQRAAQARRNNARDPIFELTSPPNWQATVALDSPIFGELTKLFRLLDLADSSKIAGTNGNLVDISALNDCNVVLNHAERRMAQLALLNMLKQRMALPNASLAVLLWHFLRLHPLRAIQLVWRTLWKN